MLESHATDTASSSGLQLVEPHPPVPWSLPAFRRRPRSTRLAEKHYKSERVTSGVVEKSISVGLYITYRNIQKILVVRAYDLACCGQEFARMLPI